MLAIISLEVDTPNCLPMSNKTLQKRNFVTKLIFNNMPLLVDFKAPQSSKPLV